MDAEPRPAKTVIFVGARRLKPAIEQQLEARGLKVHWARSIESAARLFSALERTVVITELALMDSNWRDLVERVRSFGSAKDADARHQTMEELGNSSGAALDSAPVLREFPNRPIPILLVASASTAELWWDALECGVEDIVVAPLSASQLCQFLAMHFTFPN